MGSLWNLNDVINNVGIIFQCIQVFALAWLGNFCVSLFYNMVHMQENFEWKRCYQGLLRALSVAVGLVLITISITLIIPLLTNVGIPITDEIGEIVNTVTIVGLFGVAILHYAKEGILTFKDILIDGGVVFQTDNQEGDKISTEPLDMDEFVEEFIQGTALSTAEENIDNMDEEEPDVIAGQIGIVDKEKE